jgi:hypothetical protein
MDDALLRRRFKLGLWIAARLMPIRVRGRDLKPLLVAYEPGAGRPFAGLDATYVIDAVRRATRHPWTMRDRRCLRQGLLAYRYLGMAGFRPALHFGVDRKSLADPHVRAHCWIVLNGRVALNPPDEGMVTVLVYDGPESLAGARLPALPAIADGSSA